MADDNDDLMADVRAAMAENAGGNDGTTVTDGNGGKHENGIPRDGSDRGANEGDGSGRHGEADQRNRDQMGRFAAKAEEGKARETLSLKEKPETQAVPTTDLKSAGPQTAAPSPAPNQPEVKGLEIPPVHWKGSSKIAFARMPAEIRGEVIEQSNRIAAMEAELSPLKELFDTNREFLVNQAGSVVEAQRQMMQFARMSVDNPVQLAEHILRARGLDPRAVFGGQPSQAPAGGQQPDQQALVAQLVQQQLEPILGQFRQQSLNQEISKVQAFRDDPKHPYFNDVAPRIEGLLKAGAAKDLQEAYDQAIWADPAIRQQLLGAQAEEAKRTHAAEVAKANQARAASLRGSPLPGAVTGSGSQSGTVLDDVRAAAAEVMSGA